MSLLDPVLSRRYVRMLRLLKLDHQVREKVVMLRWEVRIRAEGREVEAAVDDNVVMTITVCPQTPLVKT
jgi:hypothetical protein